MKCKTSRVTSFFPFTTGGLFQQLQHRREREACLCSYGSPSQQRCRPSISYSGETCTNKSPPAFLKATSEPSSMEKQQQQQQQPKHLNGSGRSLFRLLLALSLAVVLSFPSQQLLHPAAAQPLRNAGHQLVDDTETHGDGRLIAGTSALHPEDTRKDESNAKELSFSFFATFVPPQTAPNDAGTTSLLQQSPAGRFDPTRHQVLTRLRLRVSLRKEEGHYVGEITMLQGDDVIGGFRVALKNEQQGQLLEKLAALSYNPDIFFQVEWEGSAERRGQVFIRAVLPLYATAFKPSLIFTLKYQHVRGDGGREEIPLHAEVPIEDLTLPGQDAAGLKLLLSKYADPAGVLGGPASFTVELLHLTKDPKTAETKEVALVPWLLHIIQTGKTLEISGKITRNVEITHVLPETPQPTWKDLLNIQLGLGEAAKRGERIQQFQKQQPGLKLAHSYLSEDGFRSTSRLSGDQPGRLRELFDRVGREGADPANISARYRFLFGPHYDKTTNPLLFVDREGNPVYSTPGFQQFFLGAGSTDLATVQDRLEGLVIPAVKVLFRFPDGQTFHEYINPWRPWKSFEEGWKSLAEKHRLKFAFREPGLRTVSINGATYALDPEFLEFYPTLLHLLARLSENDAAFAVDDVVFDFGDKLPKQLKTLFVIENHEDEGVPWCRFEFFIPLSARGAVDLARVKKKAAAAAAAPKGCNLHERNFRFVELHRWGYVDQTDPLIVEWKQTLDMATNSKAEGEKFGYILKQANLAGKQIAISFHAKHKVTAVPVTEEFDANGKVVKIKKQRPVTREVWFGEDLDGILFHFQEPLRKSKTKTMVYPFLPSPLEKQQPQAPAADALDHQRLGKTYYNRPKRERVQFRPELPLVHRYDRFVEGRGGHLNLQPLNIPLSSGAQQFSLPIGSLREWLNRYFPAAALPFDLNKMSEEDLEGVADYLFFKLPDGTKQPLRLLFTPNLFAPSWESSTRGSYTPLQQFLREPKEILIGKNFRFIITMPDGSQKPLDRTVEPGTSWKKMLTDFFAENPSVSPQQVKLVLLDDNDQPLKQIDINIDVYSSPYGVAVDQKHLKGLRITLEGLGTSFTACYQEDPQDRNRCLVVEMKRIFCGEIQHGKMRTKAWNTQCTPAFVTTADLETLEREYSAGVDDVRARTIKDLLSAAKGRLKSQRPDIAAKMKLPLVRVEENPRMQQLLQERTTLLTKPQKTLKELDRLREVRQQLKQQQREAQEPWARLTSITVLKRRGGGSPQKRQQQQQRQQQQEQQVEEIVIPLNAKDFFMSDRLWKVFKYASNARRDLQLQFDEVFNFTFEVLDEQSRKTWKTQQQQVQKAKEKRRKPSRKVLADVVFVDIDGTPVLTDIGVDLNVKVESLAAMSKGEKKNLLRQLQRIYNIPPAFFIQRSGYPRVQLSGSRWSVSVLLGLVGGAEGRGLRPLAAAGVEGFIKLLQQKGGLLPSTIISVVPADGTTLRIPLEEFLSFKIEQIKELYFPWNKPAGQVQEEKKKEMEEKRAEAAGIARTFRVDVSNPADWQRVIQEWLGGLYDLQLLNDSPLTLKIKTGKDTEQQQQRCLVKMFGELLRAVDEPQLLLRLCPGLDRMHSPFSFVAEIRGPPLRYFRLFNRPPSKREKERNPRLLGIFKTRLLTVPDDGKIEVEYGKQKRPLSREELKKMKVLLREEKPEENPENVITRLLQLLGFTDEQIAKPGKLRFILSEKPTSEEEKLVKEGMLLVVVEDLQSGMRPLTAPLTVAGDQGLQLEAPAQLYKVFLSVFSQKQQQLNVVCGVKSGKEVAAATWSSICSWCRYKLEDLPALGKPLLIFKLVSKSKSQPYEGNQPVTVTMDGRPLVYDVLQPGSAHGETGIPLPVLENLLQRPGPGELGPLWRERLPAAAVVGKEGVAAGAGREGMQQRLQYIPPDASGWEKFFRLPTAAAPPAKSVSSLNFFHTNPEAAETGKAYDSPLRWGFNFPAYAQVNNFRPLFQKLLVSVPPAERHLYKVFLQIPKNSGRMYECAGIQLENFLNMNQQQIAAACGVDPLLLAAPFGVYLMRHSPTFAGGQPEFPFTFFNREREPQRGTGTWQQAPGVLLLPLLEGAAATDLVEIEFAPEVGCSLTQKELMEMKTWEELLNKCGINFGNQKPASLTIRLQPVFSTPNVKFQVPRVLLQPLLQQHGNVSPDLLFREWPLQRIIAQLLSHAGAGFYEVLLKFNDQSVLPYSNCPESYKDSPPSQIPGLIQVIIKQTSPPAAAAGTLPPQPLIYQGGSVPAVMRQLQLPPDTSYGEFTMRVNQQLQQPEGFSLPGTSFHIGGTAAAAGREGKKSVFEVELITDEQPAAAAGGKEVPGATRPVVTGTFPDNVSMKQLLQGLTKPQILITQKSLPEITVEGVPTYGGDAFHAVYVHLDQPLHALVDWMLQSLGVDDAGDILVDFLVDHALQRVQMKAIQLKTLSLADLLRHLGVVDLENAHTLVALPIPAPGVHAKGSQPHKLVINGREYPGPANSPKDFATLFGMPRGPAAAGGAAAAAPQQDLQLRIRTAADKPEVSGIVPHDMLPWLEKISDKHGQPGLNLVLNFLNQLHALSELPPGGALSIQTELIPAPNLQTLYPPGQVPQEGAWVKGVPAAARAAAAAAGAARPGAAAGAARPGAAAGAARPGAAAGAGAAGAGRRRELLYPKLKLHLPQQQQELLRLPVLKLPRNYSLVGTAGPSGKEFFLPGVFSTAQQQMPVGELLRLSGIQPQALRSIKVVTTKPEEGSIEVSEGSIHVQPLEGEAFTIPLRRISSGDHTPLLLLLQNAGHSVEELVGRAAAAAAETQLALKVRLQHGARKETKITTPIGTVEHLRSFFEELSLWKILPPLINVKQVERVWLRLVVAKEYQEEPGEASTTKKATGEEARPSSASAAAAAEEEKKTEPPAAAAPGAEPSPATRKKSTRSTPAAAEQPPPTKPATAAAATPPPTGAAATEKPPPPRPAAEKPQPTGRPAAAAAEKPPPTGRPAAAAEKPPATGRPAAAAEKPPATGRPAAAAEKPPETGRPAAAEKPPPTGGSAAGGEKRAGAAERKTERTAAAGGEKRGEEEASVSPRAAETEGPAKRAEKKTTPPSGEAAALRRTRVPSSQLQPLATGVPKYPPTPLLPSEFSGYRVKDTTELFLELEGSTKRMKFGEPVTNVPLLRMTVKDALAALVPTPTGWYRCFWGEISAEETHCIPKREFSYQYWMKRPFWEVYANVGHNCLLIKHIQDLKPLRNFAFFPVPHFYHEPVVEVYFEGKSEPELFFEEELPPRMMGLPVSLLLERQGWKLAAMSSASRCLVNDIYKPRSCKTKYAATIDQDTLRSAAITPAFFQVFFHQSPTSFLQVIRRRQLSKTKRHVPV